MPDGKKGKEQMNINYEMLVEANKSINTTKISGKEYAEVNQRVKAFRMIYPTGTIRTEIVSIENGICIIKATVSYVAENSEEIILGTGTAYEKEGSSFINKTSYIENCETSAVGRALGFVGFGIDTSIASAEEVSNAIVQQNSVDLSGLKDNQIEWIVRNYDLDNKADITEEILADFNKKLEEKKRGTR